MTTPNYSDNEHIHDAKDVLDKIHEGVLLLNVLGSITFVNMNFQKSVSHSQRELEGLRFDQLMNF